MKFKFILILFIATTTMIFADTDFINYYNKAENWISGEIGNGQLEITETVTLQQDVQLPTTAKVSIINNGVFNTNGHAFLFSDDYETNQDVNPIEIYNKKIEAVLLIINQLLLD